MLLYTFSAIFFFFFYHKICVFIILNSFFWWSIKFAQQNINQSEAWIGGFQLSVELQCLHRTVSGSITKPPTTDRPSTADNRPPTHRQVLHWPTNHQLPAYWQFICRTTDPPTNRPTEHRPPTLQLSWTSTLWMTKLILTESPLDQFFH